MGTALLQQQQAIDAAIAKADDNYNEQQQQKVRIRKQTQKE